MFCWRRWPWLAFATLIVSAPQWGLWLVQGQPRLLELAVLTTFGSIGLLGAVFAQARSGPGDRILGSASALLLLGAVIIGVAGRFAFGLTGGAFWLAGMAVVHIGAGVIRKPGIALTTDSRRLLISIGVIAADVALASLLHGVALAAAWGVASLAFALLARLTRREAGGEAWLAAALGTHVALVLAQAESARSPFCPAPGSTPAPWRRRRAA